MSRDCHLAGIPTMRDKQFVTLKPHVLDGYISSNKMRTWQVWRHRSRNIRPPAAQSRLRELRRWLAPPALCRIPGLAFHIEIIIPIAGLVTRRCLASIHCLITVLCLVTVLCPGSMQYLVVILCLVAIRCNVLTRCYVPSQCYVSNHFVSD